MVNPWEQKAQTWRKSWMAERQRLLQMEKLYWQLKSENSDFYARIVQTEKFLISEGYRKLDDAKWTKEPLHD